MITYTFCCEGCGRTVITYRFMHYRTIPASIDNRNLCNKCKEERDMALKPMHVVDLIASSELKRRVVVARFKTTREAEGWIRGREEFVSDLSRYVVEDTTEKTDEKRSR